MTRRRWVIAVGAALVAGVVGATLAALRPVPERLVLEGAPARAQFLDRRGTPLNVTWRNDWNLHAQLPLHAVPELMRAALLESEDRRFLDHGGPDWQARLGAVWQNLSAGRAVRGASTITEQVVRMWQPRPRTLWTRWVEGFEAARFESRFSKGELFEFYLNQVPFAAQRRGVLPASRYWFGRDLGTLSRRETLALAVLVRAPSRYDLRRDPAAVDRGIADLATRLERRGVLAAGEATRLLEEPLALGVPLEPVEAGHFVRHAVADSDGGGEARRTTTLDGELQQRFQGLLDSRIEALAPQGVANGAVLVLDHRRDEIIAWVVGRAGDAAQRSTDYDAVLVPRQPGSTLKPLLYAIALERGWTAATLIEDSPLEERVGNGLHEFRNYSRNHYGPITLREALGNSLNVPAVRTVRFVGVGPLLGRLRALGMTSLGTDPNLYGEGLALGNGEVTLYELTQGYAALARGGIAAEPRWDPARPRRAWRVFEPEAASLIGDILSDPSARRREFGGAPLMRMPVQTAVKTGTSNDHRDAWAMGFDSRFTVGVWMGNLDARPTDEVTGSTGPMVVLRAVFAELNRDEGGQPLWLSPRLVGRGICALDGGPARADCPQRHEWFVPGTEPDGRLAGPPSGPSPVATTVAIARPSDGLLLAADPRVPDALEAFEFELDVPEVHSVEWRVDGVVVAETAAPRYAWPVVRGAHRVAAKVWLSAGGPPQETVAVGFTVR